MEQDLDFLVLGGGPGGYSAALRAAELGRDVTLVDTRGAAGLGGNCLHEGCIPTKALLNLAERCSVPAELAAAGLSGAGAVDLPAFQQWKAGLISRLSGGVEGLLRNAGVKIVAGFASFTGPSEVSVAGAEALRARFADVVIATGSRPLAPPGLPIDGTTVIDSTRALALEEVPASLLVVGGGSVGMELGTVFAKLGSRVTVVEQADELLPMIDPRLVRPLRKRLGEVGVEVITAATVADCDGTTALVRSPRGEVRVAAQRVLAGVGRRPQTDRLDLGAAGLQANAGGFLEPDPVGLVAGHAAAVGDVTRGPFHAHRSAAEGARAAEALCGLAVGPPPALPFIAHSDPEIASVGMTPAQARAAGPAVRVATFPLRALGWAVAAGGTHGSALLVAAADSDVVLGVHLVGPAATELIGEGVLAIEVGATASQLRSAVHAHPTFSEQLPEVAHRAMAEPLRTSRTTLPTP